MQLLNHYETSLYNSRRIHRRLLEKEVLYIKAKAKEKQYSWIAFDKGLARVFKVDPSTIKNIRLGKTYKNIIAS